MITYRVRIRIRVIFRVRVSVTIYISLFRYLHNSSNGPLLNWYIVLGFPLKFRMLSSNQ